MWVSERVEREKEGEGVKHTGEGGWEKQVQKGGGSAGWFAFAMEGVEEFFTFSLGGLLLLLAPFRLVHGGVGGQVRILKHHGP